MGDSRLELDGEQVSARLLPERGTNGGYSLVIEGTTQSHVNPLDPLDLQLEYTRLIAAMIDGCRERRRSPADPAPRRRVPSPSRATSRPRVRTRCSTSSSCIASSSSSCSTCCRSTTDVELTVEFDDGRAAVERAARTAGGYDVAIVDVFSGSVSPRHMSTVEFFTELVQLLAPDGVVVVNTLATSGLGMSREVGATLASILPEVLALASPAVVADSSLGNVVFAASAVPIAGDEFLRHANTGPRPIELLRGASATTRSSTARRCAATAIRWTEAVPADRALQRARSAAVGVAALIGVAAALLAPPAVAAARRPRPVDRSGARVGRAPRQPVPTGRRSRLHQLRPRVHGRLPRAGQLRRVLAVGHRRPRRARAHERRLVPGRPGRRERRRQPRVRLDRRDDVRRLLPGGPRARDGGELGGAPDLRHQRSTCTALRRRRAHALRIAHPHGRARPGGRRPGVRLRERVQPRRIAQLHRPQPAADHRGAARRPRGRRGRRRARPLRRRDRVRARGPSGRRRRDAVDHRMPRHHRLPGEGARRRGLPRRRAAALDRRSRSPPWCCSASATPRSRSGTRGSSTTTRRRIVFQDELGDGFINTCSPAFGADRGADAVWLIEPDGLAKAGTFKLPRDTVRPREVRRALGRARAGSRPLHHRAGLARGRGLGRRLHRPGRAGGAHVVRPARLRVLDGLHGGHLVGLPLRRLPLRERHVRGARGAAADRPALRRRRHATTTPD